MLNMKNTFLGYHRMLTTDIGFRHLFWMLVYEIMNDLM